MQRSGTTTNVISMFLLMITNNVRSAEEDGWLSTETELCLTSFFFTECPCSESIIVVISLLLHLATLITVHWRIKIFSVYCTLKTYDHSLSESMTYRSVI